MGEEDYMLDQSTWKCWNWLEELIIEDLFKVQNHLGEKVRYFYILRYLVHKIVWQPAGASNVS
jgi:hypothetical protein